ATPAATSPDLPRDAVGPEQDAQVGVEAVARVDEVLVGELKDGRAVRPFEVDVDRAVTGVEPQDLLEPVDLLVRQGRPLDSDPDGRPAVEDDLGLGDLHGDD